MTSYLDVCRFTPASGGTGSFVVSSAVGGYQTPATAGAVNGATYAYRAESADLSQWEIGYGTYTVSTTTLARTTILTNSSGNTSAINFTVAPQVALLALAEDLSVLVSGGFAQSLTTAQKRQAQSNIFIGPTTQTFLSGTAQTYTTPAGCLWIEVEMQGGGGGGGGSGSTSGAAGTAGGNTTFSGFTANGGAVASATLQGSGGAASGGAINLTGGAGQPGIGLNSVPGGAGGISLSGGAGWGGNQGGTAGGAAATNSGSGGGGGGSYTTSANSGGGGGAGGYCYGIINNPAATYTYTVGAAGTAQGAGTNGYAGGAGAAGWIKVTEHYGA
ncbi:hypothetical protein [Bradyrhizobium ivorense]|uniref:hypothetical protein n=1 Tax=Bradyrhizobium ivorense TaxID=2511166 RepID=UPI0010B41D4E|nr:hypothetical protein [Bradyrhizobium ivorense]VIO73896.1 hypothetical protein CI41S_40050 [Bradyrhizobium ivorense]